MLVLGLASLVLGLDDGEEVLLLLPLLSNALLHFQELPEGPVLLLPRLLLFLDGLRHDLSHELALSLALAEVVRLGLVLETHQVELLSRLRLAHPHRAALVLALQEPSFLQGGLKVPRGLRGLSARKGSGGGGPRLGLAVGRRSTREGLSQNVLLLHSNRDDIVARFFLGLLLRTHRRDHWFWSPLRNLSSLLPLLRLGFLHASRLLPLALVLLQRHHPHDFLLVSSLKLLRIGGSRLAVVIRTQRHSLCSKALAHGSSCSALGSACHVTSVRLASKGREALWAFSPLPTPSVALLSRSPAQFLNGH